MILFITRKYPPSIGGMEKFGFQLYENISKHTPISVISWGKSQIWLPFFMISALFRAIIYSFQEEFQVIYLGDPVLSPIGIILKSIFRLPIVINAHGYDITYPNSLYQMMLSFCLPRMDHVLCISKHSRDACLKKGVQLSKTTIINPGMDIKNYSPTLPYEEKMVFFSRWGIQYHGQKILISVGRLVLRKGIAPFIENALPLLANQLEQWIYIIVGEGPEKNNIESAIKSTKLSENIKCIGSITDTELKNAYAISDVFIMPNIQIPNEPEGFGLVSIEAQAAGLPVVLSDLEGIRETVIKGSDAHLIEPEDWIKFFESIAMWISRDSLPEERMLRHKIVFEHFDWHVVTPRIISVFRRVLQEHWSK